MTRTASGLLTSITAGWGNFGMVETSGLDFNAKLNFELGPGRWSSNFQFSHVFDYSFSSLGYTSPNIAGWPGWPQARATLSNYYDIDDFTLSWNTEYIADQFDTADWDAGTTEGHVPTWVTHDLQINYHAPWDGKFTIGARNVFDKKPAIHVGATGSRDYNFNLYNGSGRTLYAEYTQTFD